MTIDSTSEIHKQMALSALGQQKHIIIHINPNNYIVVTPYFSNECNSTWSGFDYPNEVTGNYVAAKINDLSDLKKDIYNINWNYQFAFSFWQEPFRFVGIYNPEINPRQPDIDDWMVDSANSIDPFFNIYRVERLQKDRVIATRHSRNRFSDTRSFSDTRALVLTNEFANLISQDVRDFEFNLKETVTIDGITYDKQAIKNRIKELKPVE